MRVFPRRPLPVALAAAFAVVATGDAGTAPFVGALLHALKLMRDSPGWMSNREACAKAVDNTLTTLGDEYLDPNVAFVLANSCDHRNVWTDFGGSEAACRPIFGDLGRRFDGKKDYAAWCADTAQLLGTNGGGAMASSVAAPSGGDSVAVARQELDRIKEKKARGGDIKEDLGHLRKMVSKAEHAAAKSKAKSAAKDMEQADVKVGESSWGQKAEPAAAPAPKPAGQRRPPFADVAPFGGEQQAGELTDGSVEESNKMVDQIERAASAEEKRSAYRALTHLRHTAVSSFDGVAKTHMQNIHEYNENHSWRDTHPVRHLAEEEGDVAQWALPDPSQ